MSKYINADDIKNDIKTLWDWETVDGIKSSTVLKQVLSDIDNINEAVVRCKNCEFYDFKRTAGLKKHGYCEVYNGYKKADGFCDCGERRESE